MNSKDMPKVKVLYVDDDAENLTSFKAVFRRLYDVHLASNAKKAIEILKKDDIQVLITDQRMPEMTGSELLEIAAKEYPETIRFMLTGFCDYDPLVDAINSGKLHGYFSKPFDTDNIKLRIEDNLKNYYLEVEKKQLLRNLQQKENFLNTIIENIPHMIFIKDAKTLSYIRINKAGEELTGYSCSEIVGKTDYDLFPRNEADHSVHTDREVLLQKELFNIPEESIQTRHKGLRFLNTQKMLITDEAENPLFVLGISRDITEEKRLKQKQNKLEKQIRQTWKMEALGILAGGIAHDFNNILTIILGYIELSAREVEKDSKISEWLNKIYSAGCRAKDLVQQILTFARKSDQKPNPLQVGPIAKEALKLLRSSIPATIDIQSDIKSDSMVLADATQIHQIFMNLCTNAAQAMEETGGLIKVIISDVFLEKEYTASYPGLVPGENVKIQVSDTGAGISANHLEYIFEPYYTTKDPGEGTGLGLAVVHGAVKSCGGEIIVESELHKGTRFTIYIPVTQLTTGKETILTEELTTGKENILIVDDESSICEIYKHALEGVGYHTTCCFSSLDALEIFKDKSDVFDLVITDMTMPHMTGDKLAQRLIEIKKDLPVIITSGYTGKLTQERLDKIGTKGFLMKPVSIYKLSETIRNLLDD